MILQHDFNSSWWGAPIGISSDVNDLFLTREQLSTSLSKFEWIEFRVPVATLPSQKLGPTNGAHMVDVQLSYQKNISRLNVPLSGVEIMKASEIEIDFNDFSPFSHERYIRLNNADHEKLAMRYSLLAQHLVQNSPNTCATVFYKSSLVGYVFGHVTGTTAVFDLAVTSKSSQISGQILYEAAGHFFHMAGANKMTSSFNAANIGALNAHVRLQCRFLEATSIWLLE